MKVKSNYKDGIVYFDDFLVKQIGKNYFGVFDTNGIQSKEITHSSTFQSACKKAKLLQIGWNLRKNEESYQEAYYYRD